MGGLSSWDPRAFHEDPPPAEGCSAGQEVGRPSPCSLPFLGISGTLGSAHCGLSYNPLDPQISLPSVSLPKLALTFFLFNNTSVSIPWLTFPKREDGASLRNCSVIVTATANTRQEISVGWAPQYGFLLILTAITMGRGCLTTLILDTRTPRLPREAGIQQLLPRSAKPRGEER